VDNKQFIFRSQLCGDLVTGGLSVRHPYSKRERGYGR
jgi:hypothetical protein